MGSAGINILYKKKVDVRINNQCIGVHVVPHPHSLIPCRGVLLLTKSVWISWQPMHLDCVCNILTSESFVVCNAESYVVGNAESVVQVEYQA